MLNPVLTTAQIRKLWLQFFANHQHHFMRSVSVVPMADDSLLFINSGIATLKPHFTGALPPPAPNLVHCQAVVRTNDIELVGQSVSHNTWFEMLGSFSIGGYFKTTAIKHAWEFLTSARWLGIAPDRLYVTVLNTDHATLQAWAELTTLPPDHIVAGDRKTNFWQIGAGPCGPCTEIYYDLGAVYDPDRQGIKLLMDQNLVNHRFLEIWNIVFSQFNYDGQRYVPLAVPKIDTGAGLERISCALQQKSNSYETDIFTALIHAIEQLTPNHQYRFGLMRSQDEHYPHNADFRIIADHIRAVVMIMQDGIRPGSKKREYVVRKLIRRAVLQASHLKLTPPFLCRLVPAVIQLMSDFYPELKSKEQQITAAIETEERLFGAILSKSQSLVESLISNHAVTAERVFMLYEAHGVPLDLLRNILTARQITTNWAKVNQLVTQHRSQSQQAQHQSASFKVNPFLFLQALKLKTINCYETTLWCKTKILVIFSGRHKVQNKLAAGHGYLVLAETPFFAEQGGQKADVGTIFNDSFSARVVDVQKGPDNIFVHSIEVLSGVVQRGDEVMANVDEEKRAMSARHHTATHFLNAAVCSILGSNVQQIGSFNSPEGLRLDINWSSPLDIVQLGQLEHWVNDTIKSRIKVNIVKTSYQEAKNVYHAWSLFDNYAANTIVRVVKYGDRSVELCGGTHCANTQDVEAFIITKVISKGKNRLRFYAVAGHRLVNQFIREQYHTWNTEIRELLVKNQKIVSDNWARFNPELKQLPTELLDFGDKLDKQIKRLKAWSPELGNHLAQKKLFEEIKQNLVRKPKQFTQALQHKKLLRVLPAKDTMGIDGMVFRVFGDDINLQAQLNIWQKLEPNYFFWLLGRRLTTQQDYQFIMGWLNSAYNLTQVFKLWCHATSFEVKGGGNHNLVRGIISHVSSVTELKNDFIKFWNKHLSS